MHNRHFNRLDNPSIRNYTIWIWQLRCIFRIIQSHCHLFAYTYLFHSYDDIQMHEKHRNSKHFQASMLYFSNLREVHVSFMNHRNPFHFFKFKEISLCDKTLLRLSTSSIQIITVRDFSFSSPLRNGLNDMTQFLRDGVRGESVDKRIICRSIVLRSADN